MNFAKIKSLREELGLTQQQAAERAKLRTAQNWNNIESGRRSNLTVKTLEAIAKALNVKPADLLK